MQITIAKYSCTEEYQKTLGDVDDNISHPVGIIGCRSTISEISFDCCEYDLAIFNSEQTNESNRILNIGNYNVELITLPTLPKHLTDILVLKDMILLHDDNKFMLSSIIEGNSNSSTYRKMLTAFGKRAIIRSLFRYEKINRAIQTQPILAAMWMKISAYDFLEGILSLGGSKPMPLHELYQIRNLTIKRQDIADAIIAALECIGVERATRSNISRSFQGVYGLNSTQYHRVDFYKNEASTSDWHVARLLLLPRQDWRKKLAGKK